MISRSLGAVALSAALLCSCGAGDDHSGSTGGGGGGGDAGTTPTSDGGTDPSTSNPPPQDPSPGKLPPQLASPGTLDPTDADGDGISDALEVYLAEGFSPEVRLAPDAEDWTRPANVDWYLTQVKLSFSHGSGCNDHDDATRKVGAITQTNLLTASHYVGKGSGWTFNCADDTTKPIKSTDVQDEAVTGDWKETYFLEIHPEDDAARDLARAGSPPSDWPMYVHVKKNTQLAVEAYDIQYWFFYAFNDSYASVNHEADWEHITVTVDASLKFIKAYYSAHSDGADYTSPTKLYWVNESHPVVYSADGSHAAYPTAGEYPSDAPGFPDHTYEGGPVWSATGSKLVQLGEKTKPTTAGRFIQYGGRWGEIGETTVTSGPTGPAFKARWNTY